MSTDRKIDGSIRNVGHLFRLHGIILAITLPLPAPTVKVSDWFCTNLATKASVPLVATLMLSRKS